MSRACIDLCESILLDHFGSATASICKLLFLRGACSLAFIKEQTKFSVKIIKQCLRNMVHLGIVAFQPGSRGVGVEFRCDHVAARNLLRAVRYVLAARELYGPSAELIVDELIADGPRSLSSCVKSTTAKMIAGLEGTGTKVTSNDVYESFKKLAQAEFIRRCPSLVEDESDTAAAGVPTFSEPENPFELPEKINLGTLPGEASASDGLLEGLPSRKRKLDADEPDGAVLWQANPDRFRMHFRDELIAKVIDAKLGERYGAIVRAFLRLSHVQSDVNLVTSAPLSANEIHKAYLPSTLKLSKMQMDAYLSVIAEDSNGFFTKCDDSGGGMYVIDYLKALRMIAQATVESMALEKFGTPGLRMFKLLIEKSYLEQAEIEKCSLLPPKEAKDIMYNMYTKGYLSAKFVPKTNDFAPSRTFSLFHVDFPCLAKQLLQIAYKSQMNLILTRQHQLSENKALLEMVQKVETLKDQIKQELQNDPEAMAQQIREIEDGYLPTAARQALQKHQKAIQNLYLAEIQNEETIFILETYLAYLARSNELTAFNEGKTRLRGRRQQKLPTTN